MTASSGDKFVNGRILIALLVPLLLGVDTPPDDAVKKEWASLEGTWLVTKMEIAGKSLLEPDKPAPQIVIKDGKVTGQDGPNGRPADSISVRLDPSQKPKTLTSTVENGLLTILGIYTFDKDELKVCAAVVESARAKEREKERPKEFDSKQGILIVFQRVKK